MQNPADGRDGTQGDLGPGIWRGGCERDSANTSLCLSRRVKGSVASLHRPLSSASHASHSKPSQLHSGCACSLLGLSALVLAPFTSAPASLTASPCSRPHTATPTTQMLTSGFWPEACDCLPQGKSSPSEAGFQVRVWTLSVPLVALVPSHCPGSAPNHPEVTQLPGLGEQDQGSPRQAVTVNPHSGSWISVIPARSFVLTTTEASPAWTNMQTQGCAGQGPRSGPHQQARWGFHCLSKA